MLKASLELNRALGKIVQMSQNLGDVNDLNDCNIDSEELISASTKFLKCYELCVRIDEALGDIVRHQGTSEIERSLEHTKELINMMAEVVMSFNSKERRIFISNTSSDFFESKKHLDEFLKKRPGERILHEDGIKNAIGDLSDSVRSFRKSAGYALLMAAIPKSAGKKVKGIKC